jgi:O-methyltransferase involved in polyketide biosynthesis
MTEHIKVDLGSVQKTLLLPLWGRAVETAKQNPKLKDPAAVEIIEKIDYDFSTIAGNISFVTQLAWIARSLHIDSTINEFLSLHPDGVIVNLGCGLDTTYDRVNNGKLSWYDLDMPDVIALRKNFLQETENRRFISASLISEEWPGFIIRKDAVLFIAAGVLYYFDEGQVKNLFGLLSKNFPRAELIFDAVTKQGLDAANKRVIQKSGMDKSAYLKWSIKSSKGLPNWDIPLHIISEYPLFRGFKKSLTLKEKYGTFLSDVLRIMYMVLLKFGNN